MLYQSCHIIKIPSSTRYHHQDISCDDGSIMRSFFAHVHLILKLFLKLTKFFTFTWLQKFVRLILFAVLLLPAFARVGYFYFTDKRIERGVRFGQSARNFLDIYGGTGSSSSSSSSSSSNEEEQLHNNNKNNNNNDEEEGKKKKTVEKKPIVIFITGGVWIIGHRLWGALLARSLLHFGIICVCVDYRNFPQGSIGEMVQDVSNGIGYAVSRAKSLGGDVRKINLIGQSAGAHLAALALLRQSQRRNEPHQTWHAKDIIGFIGISGIYQPESQELIDHFDKQGLHKNIFFSIMEAGFSMRHIENLTVNSPSALAKDIGEEASYVLPRFLLIHGEKDVSAPPSETTKFAQVLRKSGISVSEKYYKNKGHVEPFICDPILGRSEDLLLEDILTFITRREGLSKTCKRAPLMRPRFIVEIAKRIVPF